MTPKVVRTVEDGRRLSIEARDESGIITDNMKQSTLFQGLQVKPEDAAEISTLDGPLVETENGVVPARYDMTAPVEPEGGAAPSEPRPSEPDQPRYGPEVPKYGPMVPSGEDVVARK
jgi:hypothetical protein